MSSVTTQNEIEYPESDGKPMGETDLHRDWMFRLLEIFRQRYRGQRVYIASDLLVYFEEGSPSKFVVPDCFVVLDCEPGRRRTFQTWKEKRVPDVVFEVTSRGTSSIDIVDKPVVYERMGVQEYFLYDPTASYLEPSLQGYRMTNGTLHQIAETKGRLRCETLGVELFLREDDLVIVDTETGVEQVTKADAEEFAREQAQRMHVEAMRKQVEAQQKQLEAQQKQLEAQKMRELELEARLIAERRVRELEEKIRRLEGGS
jgi:Uma2 family endonuclease